MIPRFRTAVVVAALMLATSGCGDILNPTASVPYSRSDDLEKLLGEKPNLKAKVVEEVDRRFGANPREIKVPQGAGLRDGGRHLAAYAVEGDDPKAAPLRIRFPAANGEPKEERGAYSLYRQHCLHCHGVTGDGDGPTAPFLFPRPRDYRKGVYKFTSTGGKPTREDLRKTIVKGLDGTSMPSFEALMSADEIEQVIDYVVFLSMRGELEYRLVQESKDLDDKDEVEADIVQEDLKLIFMTWKDAENRVAVPDAARTAGSAESIQRGRTLYLGLTKEQLQCSGCHGLKAQGNGQTWVDPETFNHYVFDFGVSRDRFKELGEYATSRQKKWSDDWGDPIRPANLAKKNPMYKGGRRPIDLFWRIRNGIGQEIMPAHSNLTSAQIWDLVNFVLALPYQPELLDDGAATASAMNP